MPQTRNFPVTTVNRLRRRAEKARAIELDELVGGWQLCPVDPMELLAMFKPLRIKAGFVLRAYVYRSGSDANGVVWALPKDAPLPEVHTDENTPWEQAMFAMFGRIDQPRPPGALDDVMQAIEGDGSPWSFVCASLFAREAAEFGARWHGCWWSDWTVIGADPAAMTQRTRSALQIHGLEAFTWNEPKPAEWEPMVTVNDDEVLVTFHAHTGLEKQRISRFEDRYTGGLYTFTTREVVAAVGTHGYIH